jgi:predicted nucleic acid-binding protein
MIGPQANTRALELRDVSDAKLIYDTSVYIEVLRSKPFAEAFRPRYEANISVTFFSSVVSQELLAGATDTLKRATVEGLYRPFERSRRLVTPSHFVWIYAGRILGTIRSQRKDLKDRLAGSFVNDLLIALSAKSVGAKVITLNADDFTLIRRYVAFAFETLRP